MAAYVAPVTCPRCKGEGFGTWHRNMGRCDRCMGAGVLESDKAAIAAAKARAAARTELGRAAWDRGHEAHTGLSLLEATEPARMEAALVSWAAGRHEAVLEALEAYYRQA